MISVDDLIKWANEYAVGRSVSYPKGWVRGGDLLALAKAIESTYPTAYEFAMKSNLPE